MYPMYSYNPKGYRVSFTRSFGYAMGHVVAHTLVRNGAQTMQKMIENRHRIIDVDATEVKSAGERWAHKHAQFGGDYSRSVNKPAPRVTIVNNGTPLWKIAAFMVLGAIGWSLIGAGWFHKTPSDIVGYRYTETGEKLCYRRSNPPSPFDELATNCPRS